MKKILSFTLVFTLNMVTFSTLATASSTTTSIISEIENDRVIISVKGIKCKNGVAKIIKALTESEGVTEAKIEGKMGAKTKFLVVFSAEKTNKETIKKTVEAIPSCDSGENFPYKVRY